MFGPTATTLLLMSSSMAAAGQCIADASAVGADVTCHPGKSASLVQTKTYTVYKVDVSTELDAETKAQRTAKRAGEAAGLLSDLMASGEKIRPAGATPASPSNRQPSHQRARLVFVAGLEGSGHHLLTALSSELQKHFPVSLWDKGTFIRGISCHELDYDADHQTKLVHKFQELDPSYVHVLPTVLSYPHCGIRRGHIARRDAFHVHLGFIAKAAEEAGADLHVLFLHRPIMESLVADCIHRQFESCEPQSQTLISNADIMLRQLKMMGGARVHCFRYTSDLESMAAAVDAAFGPGMNSYNDLRNVYKAAAHHAGPTIRLSSAAQQGMERADAALEQACRGLPE